MLVLERYFLVATIATIFVSIASRWRLGNLISFQVCGDFNFDDEEFKEILAPIEHAPIPTSNHLNISGHLKEDNSNRNLVLGQKTKIISCK